MQLQICVPISLVSGVANVLVKILYESGKDRYPLD